MKAPLGAKNRKVAGAAVVISAAALALFLGANAILGEGYADTGGTVAQTAPYVAPAPSGSTTSDRSDWMNVSITDSSSPSGSKLESDESNASKDADSETQVSKKAKKAVAPSSKGKFVVPSVSLSVPLKTQPWSATIDPPDYGSVWESTGSGWGGKDQPRLMTVHSCSHTTSCAGNALVQKGKQILADGERFSVDGTTYVVTFSEVRSKADLAKSPVWDDLDDSSLVLVTCSPDGNASAAANTLFRAERLPTRM